MQNMLVFNVLWCGLVFTATCLAQPTIDYVPESANQHLVSPLELTGLCGIVQRLIGQTNAEPSQNELLGWSVKKLDCDLPPVLIEEVLVTFEVSGPNTNRWVIACLERTVARGRVGTDIWRGLSAEGMNWFEISSRKPSVEVLAAFIKRTNFGYNECRTDVVPAYVSVYAPHRALLAIAASGITKAEKKRRSHTASSRLWD